MKWQDRQGSGNIEDRRGQRMAGMGLPLGGGIGGIVLILVLSALTGTNPLDLIGSLSAPTENAAPQRSRAAPREFPNGAVERHAGSGEP
ncbi:MAG: neutral zinc metallopeptidase, partial [Vicinamibacterales bacterium]